MRRVLLTITAFLLTGCVVDTSLPKPVGIYPAQPVCEYEEDLYWQKGNPTYCYPDTCCVWEYIDYSGWLCEETWCRFENPYNCWWENTDTQCW